MNRAIVGCLVNKNISSSSSSAKLIPLTRARTLSPPAQQQRSFISSLNWRVNDRLLMKPSKSSAAAIMTNKKVDLSGWLAINYNMIYFDYMCDVCAMISDLRKPYATSCLLEDELESKDPYQLFDIWFTRALEHKELTFEEVNAVALSTVSR